MLIADTKSSKQALEAPADKDRALVTFVGRHGIVALSHVMAALDVRRAAAYRRVARLREAGLIEWVQVFISRSYLRATRQGLRYAGLDMPVAQLSAASLEHSLRCATVAQCLERKLGPGSVLSERDVALAEALEEREIACAVLGTPSKPRRHRADLAILTEEETIAVEVELTAKAPRRLVAIIRAWRLAVACGLVREVHYLCEPGKTYRAVQRAVGSVQAEGCVRVIELKGGSR